MLDLVRLRRCRLTARLLRCEISFVGRDAVLVCLEDHAAQEVQLGRYDFDKVLRSMRKGASESRHLFFPWHQTHLEHELALFRVCSYALQGV
jgi:hypothetical protein